MNTRTINITGTPVGVLSAYDLCNILDHWIFVDPVSGINVWYPLTAFGGDLIPTVYTSTVSGGPFYDICYQDVCFETVSISPVKMYCTTGVNFVLSGLDESASKIIKILYNFGDGTPIQENALDATISPISSAPSPKLTIVSHTYNPGKNYITSYFPSISVIKSDCCITTLNFTLCSYQCGILELYDTVGLLNTQMLSPTYNLVVVFEDREEQQIYANLLLSQAPLSLLSALSALPDLVEPIPLTARPTEFRYRIIPPTDLVGIEPPTTDYLYVACAGVTINPLTAYLARGEDFYLLPRSGLTVEGGAPYANIPEATGITISIDCNIREDYSYSGCVGITIVSEGPVAHIAFLSAGEELEQFNAGLVIDPSGAPYVQGAGLTFSEYCGPVVPTLPVNAVLSDITVIPADIPYGNNGLAAVSFNPQANFANFGIVGSAPTLSARIFDAAFKNQYYVNENTCNTSSPRTIEAYYLNEVTQENVYLKSGTFYLNTPPAPTKPEFITWENGYPNPYSPYAGVGKLVVKGNSGSYKGIKGSSISFYLNGSINATYATDTDVVHSFFNVEERTAYEIHTTNNFNCKSPVLTLTTGTTYPTAPTYPGTSGAGSTSTSALNSTSVSYGQSPVSISPVPSKPEFVAWGNNYPDPIPDPYAPDPYAPDPYSPYGGVIGVISSYPDPYAPDPYAPDPYSPYGGVAKLTVRGNSGNYRGVRGGSVTFYINDTIDATYATDTDVVHHFFNVSSEAIHKIYTINSYNVKSPILTVISAYTNHDPLNNVC